jgi:hypothetical protein
MATIRIKKVRFTKDEKIVLDYEIEGNDGSDKYRFTSEDPAAPSFYDAMKALASHTTELCELPESYVKRLTMKGVTYTYKGDEEIMGATMAAVMELYHSNSVIALNTPHKPSIPYDPNAKEPYGDAALSEACVNALWELARQAELYINGERGEISLFDQNNDAEKMEHPDVVDVSENIHEDFLDDFPASNVVNFRAAPLEAAQAGI